MTTQDVSREGDPLPVRYARALHRAPEAFEATLHQGMRALGFEREAVRSCKHLTPVFLEAASYQATCRVAERVFTALVRVADRAMASPALQEALHIPTMLLGAIYLEGVREVPRFGRMDGLLSPEGIYQCIEYNPLPGGSLEDEAQVEVFGEMLRRAELPPPAAWISPATAMRRWFSQDGFAPATIGVVAIDEGRAPRDLDSVGAFFASSGFRVLCGRADEFSLTDERLCLDGTPIDCVLIEDWGFIRQFNLEHPIAKALRTGGTRYLNGCGYTALLALKSLFAALSDPALEHLLESDPGEVRQHLPWTRMVKDEKTTRGGRTVDLMALAEAERERLVLKPVLGAGGDRVLLGWRCSAEVWREGLDRALSEGGVLQERVPSRTARLLRRDTRVEEDLSYDLCPYLWSGGHAEAMIARTESSVGVHNVSRGGSLLPVIPYES
jgi:hypothetical protein